MESMIGSKWKLLRPMLGNESGVIGYAFNQYEDFDVVGELGLQIIFPNGNLDGFSVNERNLFLEYIGYDLRYVEYEFKNVMQVDKDFRNKYWEF